MLKSKKADWWIAGAVVLCSAILFFALSMGLKGVMLVPEGATVRVRFVDVTGIEVTSQVKYAGAPAGVVSAMRILSAEERAADKDAQVEITLRLRPEVPLIAQNAQVSVSSDTLLSDKFILINDGPADAPRLGDGVLRGTTPVPFDRLARNVDAAVEGVRRALAGDELSGTKDLLTRVDRILGETEKVVTSIKPVVESIQPVVDEAKGTLGEARLAASDVRQILNENRAGISRAVTSLDSAAGKIGKFADDAGGLFRRNEATLNRSLADFHITMENLKVTSTFAKFLLRDLAERPSRLVWPGVRTRQIPDEREIRKSTEPVPMR